MPDIDIDVPDRQKVLDHLPHVAAVLSGPERRKHPSGIYLETMPRHPLDGLALYDYEEAERLGFHKLDLLNNALYAEIADEAHLLRLLETEPDWSLLRDKDVLDHMPHLAHHHRIVRMIAPTSVEDVALCLALIRPGKRHLLDRGRAEMEAAIWQPEPGGFVFRRSHAIAYATMIKVALNLLVERLNAPEDAS